MVSQPYVPRLVDQVLPTLLAESPAVMLVGPRAVGKTTTALRYVRSHVRLDSDAEAVAFRADPDAALAAYEPPILLDEWQEVPGVLGAVKRAVDADGRTGRFLLTGSVRGDTDSRSWPLTGRALRLPMYPLTRRELYGDPTAAPFLDRLERGAITQPRDTPDLRGYVAAALAGGFPHPALRIAPDGARRWVDSYIEQVVTRDAEASEGRDPRRLRSYLESLAASTAGIVEHKTVYDAAGITRMTADAYSRLLENLFLLDVVPAWSTNRLKRLTRAPKRYVTDACLVASALRVSSSAILRDGDLLGRVLDTFVMSQLRAEVPLNRDGVRLFHLRVEQGRHEVDVVAELGGGRLIGVEVKATAAPTADDAKHLAWLRAEFGARFVRGVVLHTGPRVFELGERILAAPISTLWS